MLDARYQRVSPTYTRLAARLAVGLSLPCLPPNASIHGFRLQALNCRERAALYRRRKWHRRPTPGLQGTGSIFGAHREKLPASDAGAIPRIQHDGHRGTHVLLSQSAPWVNLTLPTPL